MRPNKSSFNSVSKSAIGNPQCAHVGEHNIVCVIMGSKQR